MAALREKKILLFKFLAMLSGAPTARPPPHLHLRSTPADPGVPPCSVMGFWASGLLLKVETVLYA